jgi:hypothetical protein
MRWIAHVAMVMAAGLCAGMSQQPPQDRARTEGDRPARVERQPEDRESYKARLEGILVDNKRRQERLEAALKKLAEGASVEDVRRETEGPRPPGGPRELRGNRGMGGPGRPGEGRGPEQGPPLEKLSREDVIATLEKTNPEVGARFRKAMVDNPQGTERIIDRMEPMVREMKAERDPEMRQLRVENLQNGFELVGATRAFGEAFRVDANSADTRSAGEKLRGLLGTHFDLRTKMHQQEIVLLERRVVELRKDLERQLQEREKFIERRMEDVKKFRRRAPGEPKDGKPEGAKGEGGVGAEPKR